MSKHTPWIAIRTTPAEGCDGWWIKAQPHAALRGFTHDIAWVNGGEENADKARLIAAAPDLLEALKPVESWLKYAYGHVSSVTSEKVKAHLSVISAAIAKAEGQPTEGR